MTHESKHMLIAAAVVAWVVAAAGDPTCMQAAASSAPTSRPAMQMGKTKPPIRASQRVKSLRGNLDSFGLYLSYLTVKKEQSAGASFSILTPSAHMPKGHRSGVRINKAQALAIIDYLDKSGLLSRLLDPLTEAIIDMPIPVPHLHVQVIAGKHSFQNWLPIDPKAVELVEALGKLLDGDAGKAMDKLLKALEPQREKWQKAAATQPGAALPPKMVKAVKALLAKAQFVVLGKVAAVHDRTAKDAGMLYDVEVEKVLKGKWREKSLRFRSTGWIGYAKYTKGQRVLLFLRRWGDKQDELLQLRPVVYISPPQAGGLDLRPVEKYLKLIKALQPGGNKLPTERAKLLKQHVDKFMLVIRYYGRQDKDKLYYSLTLRVPVVGDTRTSFWPAAQISKAQAERIIEHLDRTGILAAAGNLHNKGFAPPKGPTYALTMTGPNELRLYEPLGWDLKMLKRLDALRKVLDGEAAKAMDKLIKALAPQRKKWENQADLEAAAGILTKTMGGTWRTRLQHAGKDAPMVLYGTMGRQDKSGVWSLWYEVFAFGRGDTASQQLLLETYTYSGSAILGADDKYTVVQRGADAKAAAKHSPVVVKALGLHPPTMALAAHAAKQVQTDKFVLSLTYKGPRGKGYRGLTLRVPKVADRGTPMNPALQISAEQAGRIVEALSKAGYFHRARPFAKGAMELLQGPTYVVQVNNGRQSTYAVIGWNLEMLGFLQTVRKALTGDAAKEMDNVLKVIEPQRKKWETAAATQPGKAAQRIQVVRDRIDSLELSIRHHGGQKDLYSLKLRVPKYKAAPREGWFEREISRQTATKLLDVLARDGFFARAEDIKSDGAPRGTYYAFWLRVHGKQRVFRYREIRGWGLEMLKCLDALRKVLDGEAGMAMDKLLKRLKPHREQWEKAAADPKYVQAHAREVEREFRQYQAKRKAGLQAEYCAWLKGRPALGPLMLPYLLASTDVGVKHHGMILARDHYGSGKIVPNAIAVLEELLKTPRDMEASTRKVACQVLGRWPDVRSVPVLLKALDDPWSRHELVGGPRGHASHLYQTVWWEADEALRAITGASPVKKPLTHVGPERGDRKAASAAWKKWWADNKGRIGVSLKKEVCRSLSL